MNSSNFYYPLSGLINAFTSIILGIFVLSRNKSNIKNITYALFCSSIAVWSSFYFIWLVTADEKIALFCSRGFMAGAIFIPVFYLHHICALLDQISLRKRIIILSYIFAVISFLFNLTPYYITEVIPRLSFKFWPTATPLFTIFLLIWGMIVIYGAYIILCAYKDSTAVERNRIRYVFIATIIGWTGGATNFPLWYDVPLPPILNILVSGYIAIVAYAIVRHHLMEIEVVIKKTLVFASLFAVAFGVFVGITVLTQELIAGGRMLGLAISSVVIILAVRPLEDFLTRVTDKYLFQKKYDYKQILKSFIDEVVTLLNLDEIMARTLDLLDKTLHPERSAILLLNKYEDKYIS